jgi:hypothetical protein
MATEEARSLLDALMGGDRNAPLPPGTAIPSKRRRMNGGGGDVLLLPGKRHKSCYDPDIDPLYTAWGVDVYELFVNTKSDLGTNPKVVDAAARQEYLQLSQAEQEALGYPYQLFTKLQELVRQGDRIVARNKEKLAQELSRKGGTHAHDFVEVVDDGAIEDLARVMLERDAVYEALQDVWNDMQTILQQEEHAKSMLEPLLKVAAQTRQQQQQEKEETEHGDTNTTAATSSNSDNGTKEETSAIPQPEGIIIKQESNVILEDPSIVKQEPEDMVMKQEPIDETMEHDNNNNNHEMELKDLQMNLGQITLRKQRLVHALAHHVRQLATLQESVDSQRTQLNYVKSDITTDKTVCEISGNFMSSRDADERIAAHYAGKQYVGWKLVRDKLAEMQRVYGRCGPPPPVRNTGPPPLMEDRIGGYHRSLPMPSPSGRGGRGPSYPPPSGGRDWGGGGGGGNYRSSEDRHGGRGGGDRGGGRWDRGGRPPSHFDGGGRRGPPPPQWRR